MKIFMEEFNNRRRDEQELREFSKRVSRQAASTPGRKSLYITKSKRRRRKYSFSAILEWIWKTVGVLLVLTIIFLGIFMCKVPIAAVLLTIFLEIALATCLHPAPAWVHIGIIIMNIVLGNIFHITSFMVLVSFIYIVYAVLIFKGNYEIDEYL